MKGENGPGNHGVAAHNSSTDFGENAVENEQPVHCEEYRQKVKEGALLWVVVLREVKLVGLESDDSIHEGEEKWRKEEKTVTNPKVLRNGIEESPERALVIQDKPGKRPQQLL